MTAHVLERSQVVPGNMDAVFGFFEDPWNLETLTPSWLHFNVHATSDRRVRLGTEIDYKLRWHIFPMTWRSRISEYVPGACFADEMLQGPYSSWYHRHLFQEVSAGVEIVDIVKYELPFGPLGRLAHAALIRDQLEGIFDYRAVVVDRLFTDARLEIKG
ncbi:MAG: SRPBCC family protein [Gemmatimonadetes bacterium]|nr:SRPBCC family protein [Gemmatimonadota bacterium]MDA1102947.1 SRPBCC family protein [Gemmatimonadota bacterium]